METPDRYGVVRRSLDWEFATIKQEMVEGFKDEKAENDKRLVKIDYTNYKGEHSIRNIRPIFVSWNANEWHPKPQWMMIVWDYDRNGFRCFAMESVHQWIGG